MRDIVSQALAAEPAPLTNEAVQKLIAAALDERDGTLRQSHATIEPEQINPMIESYLLNNPRILQRVSEALDKEIRAAEAEQARAAIAAMRAEIFDDPDHVVLGNPDGDVTLVEMFDYNCGFCRQALPDLATLIAEDPNLRVILKEFPILSPDSVDAARIGVLVSEAKVDYWDFHRKLFTSRGRVTMDTALEAARSLGLDPVTLRLEAKTPRVTAILDKSYAIARALSVSGTPTYIIGDEVIPGAVGLDQLRQRIANMRACGRPSCGDTAAAGTSGPATNG
ncbi:MAG TPA: DsbA family protein [Alphaproteobacteria bacterium]|nr:DsbA family protein [Alphaproteobacteria bacterium]